MKFKKYDLFLTDNKEIKNNKPTLIRPLADDIDLELYAFNDNWCVAVISIKKRFSVFKTKYDSGKINNDLEIMADECEKNIKYIWGLNYFRKLKI